MLGGFASDCWRSPMIQPLIDARFGVFYKVCSSAQLLKRMAVAIRERRWSRTSAPKPSAKRGAGTPGPERLTWAKKHTNSPQQEARFGRSPVRGHRVDFSH